MGFAETSTSSVVAVYVCSGATTRIDSMRGNPCFALPRHVTTAGFWDELRRTDVSRELETPQSMHPTGGRSTYQPSLISVVDRSGRSRRSSPVVVEMT